MNNSVEDFFTHRMLNRITIAVIITVLLAALSIFCLSKFRQVMAAHGDPSPPIPHAAP